MKREEVEKRVQEDHEQYSDKFSEDAQAICKLVSDGKEKKARGQLGVDYMNLLPLSRSSSPLSSVGIVSASQLNFPLVCQVRIN